MNFNPTKTELLTISNQRQPNTYPLIFDSDTLVEINTHKHLGVILQRDCKWASHIESIVAKVRPLIACLRSFKYKFTRKTLEILYKSYILPHLDYADVLWDNCPAVLANELENVHLEALRIITGSVRGTSHEKLYKESGFVPLTTRRGRHKLMIFFKIVNGLLPIYLNAYLPPLISEINPFHRRRPLERHIPGFRTELYRNSFFPSTTLLWNNLPDNVKIITSISSFKRHLCIDDPLVPTYFYCGDRKPQTIHCKLRLNMSDLNNDLYLRHISDNSTCDCGYFQEDAPHFLLHCPNFTAVRTATINTLPPLAIEATTLLTGNPAFSLSFNCFIFHSVQEFIVNSARFQR